MKNNNEQKKPAKKDTKKPKKLLVDELKKVYGGVRPPGPPDTKNG